MQANAYLYQLHSRILAAGYKTLKLFAKRTGIPYGTLCEIVNCQRIASDRNVRRIADGLRIGIGETELLLKTCH